MVQHSNACKVRQVLSSNGTSRLQHNGCREHEARHHCGANGQCFRRALAGRSMGNQRLSKNGFGNCLYCVCVSMCFVCVWLCVLCVALSCLVLSAFQRDSDWRVSSAAKASWRTQKKVHHEGATPPRRCIPPRGCSTTRVFPHEGGCSTTRVFRHEGAFTAAWSGAREECRGPASTAAAAARPSVSPDAQP